MDTASDDVRQQRWVCCQIGAREHYNIPVELFHDNRLELLITDYWAKRKSFMDFPITKNLQGRRNDEISDNKAKSFNASSLGFEIINKVNRASGWELVMKRNQWFQKKTVHFLKRYSGHPSHLFSYSYAAKDIFKYAKSKGWTTILGQIDPGPLEEEIVLNELKTFPEYKSEWQPAPKSYWNDWFEECDLADKIIVNSEWSYEALVKKGIDKEKLEIIPLTYTVPEESRSFHRKYPSVFDKSRPLLVLFLGQVILRKGIARVIEAAKLLVDQPVQFIIAGPIGIQPVPDLPNLKWVGRVPRLEANSYFKDADVFLFPTLSDGFGLTQLEARAWRLPLIVTKSCGKVVRDQYDGWVLENATAESIAQVITSIIQRPSILDLYSSNITNDEIIPQSTLLTHK